MNAKDARLRSQRAVARQGVLKESGESIEGFARRRVVGTKTRELYTKIATPLVTMIRKANVTRTDVAGIDLIVDGHLNKLYFEGGSLQEARYAVYTVCWMLVVRAAALPLGKATLRGVLGRRPTRRETE